MNKNIYIIYKFYWNVMCKLPQISKISLLSSSLFSSYLCTNLFRSSTVFWGIRFHTPCYIQVREHSFYFYLLFWSSVNAMYKSGWWWTLDSVVDLYDVSVSKIFKHFLAPLGESILQKGQRSILCWRLLGGVRFDRCLTTSASAFRD